MSRIDFEGTTIGQLPAGITTALTGAGGPVKWAVLEDATAPADPRVLAQTSADRTDYRFPLAIFDAPVATDLAVSVKFKPVAGEVDRAAGIALRLRDANNYYVVRANALEDNVRLYRVVGGQRIQFAGVNTKVPSGKWQELGLQARGSRLEVFLGGKSLFTATDATFATAGRVALWTKSDSVTYFDDITEELEALDPGTASVEVINRLKRDEAAVLNSTLLHELYFASLGGDGRAVPEVMAAALTRDFGSVDRWRKEFIALANALAGGSGWVLLTYLPRDGRLINQSGIDHNQNVAGGIPILALDMYEHAYHIDFGANAAAYIAAFMRNIEWNAVQGRYEDAAKVAPPRPLVQKEFADVPAMSPEEVRAMLDSGEGVQIIDARPRHYTTRAQDIMEGAVWRDPERLDEWIGELSKEKPVVTYCVYGFHIGCQTAIALRKAGFDARYMAGGHSAWKAIGGKVKLFE